MNTPRLIVTHSGKAHRDEFLALCVIFSHFDTKIPVERRDPTEAELADPNVWVVDVGQRYEPHLSNFDHHQLVYGTMGPQCALSQVLYHFDVYDQWKKVYGWLDVAEQLDVNGPAATAKYLDMSLENFMKTLSPVESAILTVFEENPEFVYDIMYVIGGQLLGYANAYFERLAWLRKNAAVKQIADTGYCYIWIPRSDEPLDNPALAMRQFREETGSDIPVSVTPDPRGPGYGLFRFDDDPRVDFTRLAGDDLVPFAHKGGFYATTPTLDAKVLDELVAKGCGLG